MGVASFYLIELILAGASEAVASNYLAGSRALGHLGDPGLGLSVGHWGRE